MEITKSAELLEEIREEDKLVYLSVQEPGYMYYNHRKIIPHLLCFPYYQNLIQDLTETYDGEEVIVMHYSAYRVFWKIHVRREVALLRMLNKYNINPRTLDGDRIKALVAIADGFLDRRVG